MADTRVSHDMARILIVDDTPANLHVLMELLEPAGYAVLAARSGDKALDIAAKALPDLVLLDVNMPGMDGYEVCRRLKADKQTCGIPVVFVTADGGQEVETAMRAAGGADVLRKPYDQADLLETVQAQMG